MTPITPEALLGHTFSKTEMGYEPSEVNALIHRLTESYSVLYQENAFLLKQLRETEERLRALEEAKSQTENILQATQAQRDQIIEDAYLKADSILATVQLNCESVLRSFKEKADAQEKILSDMKKNVLKFKCDLFEHYRLQIELIENLFPDNEEEQNWTPDAYAQHIISELKRKFSDQYEIFPETQMEFSFWNECKQVHDPEKQKKYSTPEQNTCHHASPKKKISKKPSPVMELIDAYEEASVKNEAKASSNLQFMLDFDHPSNNGVVIDKQT